MECKKGHVFVTRCYFVIVSVKLIGSRYGDKTVASLPKLRFADENGHSMHHFLIGLGFLLRKPRGCNAVVYSAGRCRVLNQDSRHMDTLWVYLIDNKVVMMTWFTTQLMAQIKTRRPTFPDDEIE